MKWRGRRTSSNVGFRSGGGRRAGFGLPIGRGGMSIGTLLIVGVIALLFGINPLTLLGGGGGGMPATQAPAVPASAAGEPCEMSEINEFVCVVLADTEDVWNAEFAQQNADYREPTLWFYDGVGSSGCGVAQAAVGPFYCPADNGIYIDTSFFEQLAQMGGQGDFAAAYVVAHEVGHHIQNVTGMADEVRRMQARASRTDANAIQVRMELQADCYAGVFANENAGYLEEGDIQEALSAANAIGDDKLQREAQGRVVPDSFTHGTSEQRMRWFMTGYRSGDAASCDTFSARTL